MDQQIKELLEISDFYGSDRNFVIAGGGNTSYKNDTTIWVKASGYPLAGLTEEGLVALDRAKLGIISEKTYSDDPVVREDQVKNDLNQCIISNIKGKRPSVETSLHEMIRYSFVVHLHPTLVNGLLCSRNARQTISRLFGEKALFVPYTDPGYILFKMLESEIRTYREKYGKEPAMIFLENHGVFAGAENTDGIKALYDEIISAVSGVVPYAGEISELPYNQAMHKALPAIRMMLSSKSLKVARWRHNGIISKYYSNQQEFNKISHPLIPDIIVYCKSRYMYIEHSGTAEKIVESFRNQLPRFIAEYGFEPKVVVVKDAGVFVFDDSCSSAETVLDVFEDLIRISHYAIQFGGIKFLTPEQVEFIDKWEVENYRRKIASSGLGSSLINNRIAIITGGAQGFGEGIAESLFNLGANVVIADLNENAGSLLAAKLNSGKKSNRAVFARTDVSDPESVKAMVAACVCEFGGLDIMVSNAGVLKAGSLDEMDPDTFSRTTAVNYHGYFHCAKYASEVMKIQNRENPSHFADIIQINSKSGLRGSNRNFAYAGAKFGGIGLTQSFALELAPNRIKVNSICPGNFYEGPLWSDPSNGLFVQYLKTGKVPGAKTIDDVRKFYEEQAPMKRGCKLGDVMKAILYVIDQEYETGQAIPVTGGQVMLS